MTGVSLLIQVSSPRIMILNVAGTPTLTPSDLANPRALYGRTWRRPPRSESYIGGREGNPTLGWGTVLCNMEHDTKM